MVRNFLKVSLLLAFVALVFNACEKHATIAPVNPTNGKTTAVFNPGKTYGTMTDQEGNTYKTITIGTQTWMAENLRTTRYNDGVAISNITDIDKWTGLTTGAYCNYDNSTSVEQTATYGRLYNWYAVNTGKLAPAGWHVATHDEWTTLTNYLGGLHVGGNLKETGTTHWKSPNDAATNESGFTALPGGNLIVATPARFANISKAAVWWSATDHETGHVFDYELRDFTTAVHQSMTSKSPGFSVRCVKN